MENSIILHNMTPESFRESIRELLRDELAKQYQPEPQKQYRTRKEVCTLYHISLPTLGVYVKNGIVVGHKIGRRVLFEDSEIQKALQTIPSVKYSRNTRR